MTTDPNISRVLPRRPEPAASTAAIRIEHGITRIRDAYDAVWDVMPAVAAVGLLVALILFVPRR
jgi:hypothetical protein